jgi:CRP/FNR family transcriptional regulator
VNWTVDEAPGFLRDVEELFESHTPAYRLPARAEIFRQGDSATHVYLVEAGIVGLTYASPVGREFIVGLRSRGSILGGAAAILGRDSTVSAITFQRSRVRPLSAKIFLEALKNETGRIAWHTLVTHSQEIYAQVDRMVGLALLSTRERLEEFLLTLAADRLGEQSVSVPLNQGELAEYLLATRQHLNRVLRALEEDGLLRRSNGGYLLDRSKLQRRDTTRKVAQAVTRSSSLPRPT